MRYIEPLTSDNCERFTDEEVRELVKWNLK
jgi:hypothetical protein